jgi:hypothetical protein
MRRRAALAVAVTLAVVSAALPQAAHPARATNHFTLESSARYDIRPQRGLVGVRVDLSFTNTTPDPAGQFSVFNEIRLAVHDEATEFAATDAAGDLEVRSGVRGTGSNRIHVATIVLRQPLRYNQTVEAQLTYVLPDGDAEGSSVRVRPSLVIFPAWSFGTSGEVSVTVPDGYEMRVDGDALSDDGDRLVSGAIDDPTAWLALVTALRPTDFSLHEATVPLEGGTADLLVRAFGDDAAWGERTLGIVSDALPLIEADLGLPYPVRGELVVTEAVAADASGFGEPAPGGTEIAISFEQPPFTVVHQLTHLWLPPTLVEARWIGEGLASDVAGRVGSELDIEAPYDPAAEAEASAGAAFPLDAWPASPSPEQQAYGYAAAWAFVEELDAAVGMDAIRTVLGRVASSVGPYESTEVDPPPTDGSEPVVPLSSRGFLDQLEAVTGEDLAPLFAERVLTEADVALLEARAEARAAFEALVDAAEPWGSPDPVRAAMADWRFDEAMAGAATAEAWLADRDDLLERMAAAGLSAPDRLQQAYRAYGGGGEAEAELRTEAGVVDAYARAAERVNGERTFLERLGLVGGPDPALHLALANGRFTDGDLTGAVESVEEAERVVEAAEAGGIVRLVSLLLVVLILIGLAIILFRRRAAYTREP